MKKSLITVLILLILLPVAVTGWMSWRMLHSAQASHEQELNQLITSKFSNVEQSFLDHFSGIEQTLFGASHEISSDPNTMRQLVWQTGVLAQVAQLDPKGELVFPIKAAASDDELAFIERTEHLWAKGEFLSSIAEREAIPPSNNAQPAVSKRALLYTTDLEQMEPPAPAPSAINTSQAARRGWITWHWRNGLRHIWWLESAEGYFIFELNAARLKADLINLLPDGGTLQGARIQLRDSTGNVLYQWGSMSNSDLANEIAPTASYTLDAPLASWRLDWFSESAELRASAQWPLAVAYSGFLFAILAALVFYLYREHQRELSLSRQRVSFVNQVSHELKTPLTNVRLYAELAADSLDDAEEPARSHLAVISDESARLGRLINNVLSFARAQRGTLQLNFQHDSPDHVLARTLDILQPSLTAKGIDVHKNLGADTIGLIDVDAIEQVLINLLSNVEKYARGGKRVDISSTIADGVLIVSVRDYGPGVADNHKDRIFSEFYRTSDTVDEGASGTGIGLSIARELCRLHGGDLRYEHAKPGARFIASFKFGVDAK